MNRRLSLAVLAMALAGTAGAQVQRRANISGGGNGDSGRCLAEVVVDGAAELQVTGDQANLRNLSGAQPQWRRFECSSPMPQNADVRVSVNGRGRAQVISSPRNGGPAVVRIEDSEGGSQVYQVELSWAGGSRGQDRGPGDRAIDGRGGDDRRGDDGRGGYDGRGAYGGRFSAEQAIQVCREAVRQQASERYGTRDVNFGRINVDDNPGRRDWVVGTVGVRRGGRVAQVPFSCSVNLETGRVREARIEGDAGGRSGYAGRDAQARQIDACRSAVLDKIGERAEFGQIGLDRDGDMVRGTARSRGRNYDFTCAVNGYGNVRNVDVRVR